MIHPPQDPPPANSPSGHGAAATPPRHPQPGFQGVPAMERIGAATLGLIGLIAGWCLRGFQELTGLSTGLAAFSAALLVVGLDSITWIFVPHGPSERRTRLALLAAPPC